MLPQKNKHSLRPEKDLQINNKRIQDVKPTSLRVEDPL